MSQRVMSIPDTVVIDSESEPCPLAQLTRDMKKMREHAWTEFHHRYFSRLFAYAMTLHDRNRATAEDSVQAAYLRVVRNIRCFDQEEVFWSWLTLLLRCAAADQGRKSSSRQRLHETLLNEIEFGARQPAERYGSLFVLLDEAMNELSQDDRTLLQEKYLDGESTETIAQRICLSTKAVECRLRRLRRKLKSRIHVLKRQSQF